MNCRFLEYLSHFILTLVNLAYFTFSGFLAPVIVYLVFMRETHRPLRQEHLSVVSKRLTPTKFSQKIGKVYCQQQYSGDDKRKKREREIIK